MLQYGIAAMPIAIRVLYLINVLQIELHTAYRNSYADIIVGIYLVSTTSAARSEMFQLYTLSTGAKKSKEYKNIKIIF